MRVPGGTAFIGLGTNLGDRAANLRAALRELARLGSIRGVSSVYESEPVGIKEQPRFWNMAVELGTGLAPRELMAALLHAERRLGRVRGVRGGPRLIDLDLLLYDDRLASEPELELPHPRMLERAFVLAPLVELRPELQHPASAERLADRLAAGCFERVERVLHGSDLLDDDETAHASDARPT